MTATIQERTIPADRLGVIPATDASADPTAWRASLNQHGFVRLPGAFRPDDVLAARKEVFGRLAEVGEIADPVVEGLSTGRSDRGREDLGAFWKSVSEGEALRSLTHGSRATEIMAALLEDAARPHDLMYLRPTPAGKSTRLHYDFPFFAGSSKTILTLWIPLGHVAVEDGPLVIVEGSHRFDDLLDPLRQHDFSADRSNAAVQSAAYSRQNELHPIDLVEERDTRLLTTEFHPGDVVVFTGWVMHGSLDNTSSVGRVRLSVDVRYQPAADAFDDERYFGEDPRGSKGAGYADMRGAQPLA